MNQPIPSLKLTLSKTSDGLHQYLQILSGDQFSLNIVLIANQIEIVDARPPKP